LEAQMPEFKLQSHKNKTKQNNAGKTSNEDPFPLAMNQAFARKAACFFDIFGKDYH
jgi:hypothetical protein